MNNGYLIATGGYFRLFESDGKYADDDLPNKCLAAERLRLALNKIEEEDM